MSFSFIATCRLPTVFRSSMLKIVIGSYGVKWLPHHGASGGVSLHTREAAEWFADCAAQLNPPLPGYKSADRCGLWPGTTPYRVVAVQVEGDAEQGWLVAECEPV